MSEKLNSGSKLPTPFFISPRIQFLFYILVHVFVFTLKYCFYFLKHTYQHCFLEFSSKLETQGPTVNMVLLETLAGGEVEISLHLVDLQVTIHLASLLLLGLHLGRPPLPVTLFYPLWGIEGPAFLSISFSYIFTCIAASTEIKTRIHVNGKIWI